ncbi:ArsR/SmtB family transcription factor [Roseivirga misakiensis]|uniref:Transcriptional regulator n=1 Tax=Roseivirga misakiensis TaxID=1563681 RepID=A0A1E5T0V9_9BACT|nr:helix-turn-helix domain-containing protein [Roseivirga misakiensis]OEK04985.1 transcriptional regulator [Roseivirga misakiensis]
MNIIDINKALSNKTRLEILGWLKSPGDHFPPHTDLGHFNDGVCVQYIKEKSGLSQSTISHFLSLMQKAGLIIPTRHGKWTYYKRDEKMIKRYIAHLNEQL